MLSSIHPLGERGRNNNWAITVSAFTVGAVASGAALGGLLGLAGSFVLSGGGDAAVIATAVAAGAAGVLDLGGVSPAGPSRQVNEHWIGHYRGWVYGAGFGAQLGLGVATYIVTWGVFATLAASLLSASPTTGALIGGVFGMGRSLSVLAAGWIDRPSRLGSFHQAMAGIGARARVGSALATGAVAFVFLTGVLA